VSQGPANPEDLADEKNEKDPGDGGGDLPHQEDAK